MQGPPCRGNTHGSCDWKLLWDSFSLVGDNPISSSSTKQILATATTSTSSNPPLLHNQQFASHTWTRRKLPSRKCGSDHICIWATPWWCLLSLLTSSAIKWKDNESQKGKSHTLEVPHWLLPPRGEVFTISHCTTDWYVQHISILGVIFLCFTTNFDLYKGYSSWKHFYS